MHDIVGSTKEEIRLIKSIQRKVGALDNGYIGCQTLSDIAMSVYVTNLFHIPTGNIILLFLSDAGNYEYMQQFIILES